MIENTTPTKLSDVLTPLIISICLYIVLMLVVNPDASGVMRI